MFNDDSVRVKERPIISKAIREISIVQTFPNKELLNLNRGPLKIELKLRIKLLRKQSREKDTHKY